MRRRARPLAFAALCALLTAAPAAAADDATPPAGSILINNGEATTYTTVVTLTLSATDTGGSGVVSMRFRNTDTEPYSAWEPYQASRGWTLNSEPGTKKVYAQFLDAAGNVSDKNPAVAGAQGYVDAIVFTDATLPTGAILINNGDASTNTSAVTLNLSASDAGGSGVVSMRFRNTDTEPYSAWEPYQTTRDWTLTGDLGTKKVYAQFVDLAGNISDKNPAVTGAQGYMDSIVLKDETPPTGSLLVNGGDFSTTTTTVTLTLSAADSGGSGLASMRFRNGETETYSAWEPYQAARAWTLAGVTGTREVYAQFLDGAGNVSDADPDTAGAQGYLDGIVYDPVATTDCGDCHDNPPYAGTGGGSGADAPSVMAFYSVNGHGTKTFDPDGSGPLGSRAVDCADCHELASPSPSTHLNGVFETYAFPGTTSGGPNANTSHLVAAFFGTVAAEKDWQVNFDNNCFKNAYCHKNPPARGHRHEVTHGDGVVRFGYHSTVVNPKQARTVPYWTPWTIHDISTSAPPGTSNYAPCVACHDPHGADDSGYANCLSAEDGNYHMVRKDFCSPNYFCNSNCHRR